MRVTQNAFSTSLIATLNALQAQQYNLQTQISSGLSVQAPSDNPEAMENALNYETNQALQQQYVTNAATLQSRSATTFSILQQINTQVTNAGVTATSAMNSTQADLSSYVPTINDALEAVLTQANAKDPATGMYLFGGTASSQPPFVATRDASGHITAVTYQGNTSVNQCEIAAGTKVTSDIPGANTTGSGTPGLITDASSGADLFNHLLSLRDDLVANDKTSIQNNDVPALQKDENNILNQVSLNGSLQSQLQTASAAASNTVSSLSTILSNTVGADLIQTMTQLSQAQNAYQAALASGAKVMQLSLLDYIR